MRSLLALIACLLVAVPARAEDEVAPNRRPVRVVADQRLTVTTPAGHGELLVYVTDDWHVPLPAITRAVIVLHGRLRDADVYLRSARAALAAAGEAGTGTLLIVPQFLAGIDVPAHHLGDDVLRWGLEDWEGGAAASGPAPISSFEALDAILARFADQTLFPRLAHVVVAGHSGGAQVVQRYAVTVRGADALLARGIRPRFVVSNPSSYVYFSADRPVLDTSCPDTNRWKYGFVDAPPYVAAQIDGIEGRYLARDVIYLMGMADTNPQHPALDRTCMAEAQGPFRFARALNYWRYLHARDGEAVRHAFWPVAGVGHDGEKMLGSACGQAALFDAPGCTPPPVPASP